VNAGISGEEIKLKTSKKPVWLLTIIEALSLTSADFRPTEGPNHSE
jgi:hypothetical protein